MALEARQRRRVQDRLLCQHCVLGRGSCLGAAAAERGQHVDGQGGIAAAQGAQGREAHSGDWGRVSPRLLCRMRYMP